MPKLTKRFIDATTPGPSDQFIWDDELPSFGVRIKPSGVRSYLIQYRNQHGRSRRLTLGQHGVLTADEARKIARQHLADVVRGKDPVEERDTARQAPSVADLCARYLADHVGRHNKAKTVHEIKRLIDKIILPRLGHLKLRQLHATTLPSCTPQWLKRLGRRTMFWRSYQRPSILQKFGDCGPTLLIHVA